MKLAVLWVVSFIAGLGLGYLKHRYFSTSIGVSTGYGGSQYNPNYDDDIFTIDTEFQHIDEPISSGHSSVNPASGLLMMGDSMIDVAGNPYGVDLHSDIGSDWSDSSFLH